MKNYIVITTDFPQIVRDIKGYLYKTFSPHTEIDLTSNKEFSYTGGTIRHVISGPLAYNKKGLDRTRYDLVFILEIDENLETKVIKTDKEGFFKHFT